MNLINPAFLDIVTIKGRCPGCDDPSCDWECEARLPIGWRSRLAARDGSAQRARDYPGWIFWWVLGVTP